MTLVNADAPCEFANELPRLLVGDSTTIGIVAGDTGAMSEP